MSGLKVNWSKSHLLGWPLSSPECLQMANLLGCSYKRWPTEYLGLQLVGSPRIGILESGFGRYRKKLSDGGLTMYPLEIGSHLSKATLSNLPICYLSLFKIPKGVSIEPETLQNQFLWRGQSCKISINELENSLFGKEIRWIGFGRTC